MRTVQDTWSSLSFRLGPVTVRLALPLRAPYPSQSGNGADWVPLGGAKSPDFCGLCPRQEICCKSSSSDLSTKQSKRWSWKDQTLSEGAHNKVEAHLEWFRRKSSGKKGECGFLFFFFLHYFFPEPSTKPST